MEHNEDQWLMYNAIKSMTLYSLGKYIFRSHQESNTELVIAEGFFWEYQIVQIDGDPFFCLYTNEQQKGEEVSYTDWLSVKFDDMDIFTDLNDTGLLS